jgi:hypothetical protein
MWTLGIAIGICVCMFILWNTPSVRRAFNVGGQRVWVVADDSVPVDFLTGVRYARDDLGLDVSRFVDSTGLENIGMNGFRPDLVIWYAPDKPGLLEIERLRNLGLVVNVVGSEGDLLREAYASVLSVTQTTGS